VAVRRLLSRAFDGSWLLPAPRIVLLPTTTLCYAFAQNSMGRCPRLWDSCVVGVGLLVDLGIIGSSRGRGVFKKESAAI
jgi:hypothetical protein